MNLANGGDGARSDGVAIADVATAVTGSDLVFTVCPDEVQPRIFESYSRRDLGANPPRVTGFAIRAEDGVRHRSKQGRPALIPEFLRSHSS